MEFDLLMTYIPVNISCKFEMFIFYIALVISENVHIAFLYVLSIYWCDHLNMSFMIGDRLTLDLEQYFKIYLFFSFACAIISQSWLLSIRTNVFYTERSWQRDSHAVPINPVRFCRLLGPFIAYLSCVYIALPFVRHGT